MPDRATIATKLKELFPTPQDRQQLATTLRNPSKIILGLSKKKGGERKSKSNSKALGVASQTPPPSSGSSPG